MVEIRSRLKGRVLIFGIGNPLKQDDGAGPELIKRLKASGDKLRAELLDGGSAPENHTGRIRQLKPDTLLIVDAVDFGGQPGSLRVFSVEEMSTQALSTHNVSLRTFAGFLMDGLPNLNVLVIGIQPKAVGFGEGLSAEVEGALKELCMSFI